MLDARLAQVHCRLEHLLQVDGLTRDFVLCSFITPRNTISFSALLTDSVLIRLHATPDELSFACRQLHLQVIHEREVKIPFTVLTDELVLVDCQSTATHKEITASLRLLHGKPPMSVIRGRNGSDYIVRIHDRGLLIALWRALKVVKLNGEFLNTRLNFASVVKKVTRRPRHSAQGDSCDPALDLANFPPLSVLSSGRNQ